MTAQTYDFEQARAFFHNRTAYTTGTHELKVLLDEETPDEKFQVVDVRFPDDFAAGHVPGAINLPMAKWDQPRYLEAHLDRDATLYLYCYTPTCHLAASAAAKLAAAGFRAVEVEGGWEDWVSRDYPVESGAGSAARRSA